MKSHHQAASHKNVKYSKQQKNPYIKYNLKMNRTGRNIPSYSDIVLL